MRVPFPALSVILNSQQVPSLRPSPINSFNQFGIVCDIVSFKENSFNILNL